MNIPSSHANCSFSELPSEQQQQQQDMTSSTSVGNTKSAKRNVIDDVQHEISIDDLYPIVSNIDNLDEEEDNNNSNVDASDGGGSSINSIYYHFAGYGSGGGGGGDSYSTSSISASLNNSSLTSIGNSFFGSGSSTSLCCYDHAYDSAFSSDEGTVNNTKPSSFLTKSKLSSDLSKPPLPPSSPRDGSLVDARKTYEDRLVKKQSSPLSISSSSKTSTPSHHPSRSPSSPPPSPPLKPHHSNDTSKAAMKMTMNSSGYNNNPSKFESKVSISSTATRSTCVETTASSSSSSTMTAAPTANGTAASSVLPHHNASSSSSQQTTTTMNNGHFYFQRLKRFDEEYILTRQVRTNKYGQCERTIACDRGLVLFRIILILSFFWLFPSDTCDCISFCAFDNCIYRL
jgi:hypothetical protein